LFPIKDNIPTDRFPVVTVTLIVLNVLAYFLWQRGGITLGDPSSPHYFENLVRYSEFPYEVTHPGQQCIPVSQTAFECSKAYGPRYDLPSTYVTVFTAMFMHGGLLHLGGNMLFLWIFGNNVEDSMGPVRFLLFYLLAGVAAFALQIAINPGSEIPNIGASGAVAGVLGGYILLYPRARVLTLIFVVLFFTVIELPALIVLGLWFAEQVVFGASGLAHGGVEGGGVAYFAHIGGFVFGLAAIKLFADERKRRRQQEAAVRA